MPRRTSLNIDVRVSATTYATVLHGLLSTNQPIKNLGTAVRAALEIAAKRFIQLGIVSPITNPDEAFNLIENLDLSKQGEVCSPSLLEMLCSTATEKEAETETEKE